MQDDYLSKLPYKEKQVILNFITELEKGLPGFVWLSLAEAPYSPSSQIGAFCRSIRKELRRND